MLPRRTACIAANQTSNAVVSQTDCAVRAATEDLDHVFSGSCGALQPELLAMKLSLRSVPATVGPAHWWLALVPGTRISDESLWAATVNGSSQSRVVLRCKAPARGGPPLNVPSPSVTVTLESRLTSNVPPPLPLNPSQLELKAWITVERALGRVWNQLPAPRCLLERRLSMEEPRPA
jgi:hypothetical protein